MIDGFSDLVEGNVKLGVAVELLIFTFDIAVASVHTREKCLWWLPR